MASKRDGIEDMGNQETAAKQDAINEDARVLAAFMTSAYSRRSRTSLSDISSVKRVRMIYEDDITKTFLHNLY